MLTVVVGAPFAGKRLWTDQEIERREADGEIGLLALDFTSVYSAMVPGLASVYRDSRITDSGAARFAGYVLATAVREAAARELSGYVLTDSPRRAVALAQTVGGASMVEVVVSQETALRRSAQHVELVRELAPRAGDETAERCKQVVEQYYREQDVLPPDRGRVTAPDVPSARAVTYMWEMAIRSAKRGDDAKRDKWTAAARRALKARGVTA